MILKYLILSILLFITGIFSILVFLFVESSSQPIELVLLLGIISIIASIMYAILFKSVDELIIYEKGIRWPHRGISRYLNSEELFIPFEGIEKIFLNPKSKYIVFQGSGFPGMKGYRKLSKKDIDDMDMLISSVDGKVEITNHRFCAKSFQNKKN